VFDIYHGIENFNGECTTRITDFCVRAVNPETLEHLRSEERERLHHEAVFVALCYQGLIPLDGDWRALACPRTSI
jgi:hypothetical protein